MSNPYFQNIGDVGEESPAEKGEYYLKLLDVITKDENGNPLLTKKEPQREMRYLSFAFVDADAPPFRHLVMVPGENTPADQVARQQRDMKRIVAFFGGDPNDPAAYEAEAWEAWKGWEGILYVTNRPRKDDSGEETGRQNAISFPRFE